MRERVRARRLGGLVIVVATVVVGLAAWVATYTTIFEVREVLIRGERHTTETAVASQAQVAGVNLFHLDLAAVEHRLEADPWIADAIVRRDLPATLVIDITEREPVAVDDLGEVVAADGTVLPFADVGGLPTIRPTTGTLAIDHRTSSAVAIASLPPSLQSRVGSVLALAAGALVLELRDGVTVTYGEPVELETKGIVLKAVLAWARREGERPVTIDVAVPQAPTATLEDGTTFTPGF